MSWDSALKALIENYRTAKRVVMDRLPRLAAKYGLIIVVALATPGVLYFGWQASPAAFQPMYFSEMPDAAALRSHLGPPRITKTPEFVKGIYASADTVGDKKRFGEIIDLIGQTELNALVIDLKNHRSQIAFATENEGLKPSMAPRPPLGQLTDLSARLHKEGIYIIGRLPVFLDQTLAEKRPDLAVKRANGTLWSDRLGLHWLDPSAVDVWKYNVAIASEAINSGFDEIQFDYIRFPSDGDVNAIKYPLYDGKKPKYQVITEFFSYLDRQLRDNHGAVISADLFGLTLWQHNSDLNIGQRLDAAAPRFDFVSPMVYPSHYPAGFEGYANPALYPYEVIYSNLVKGNELYEVLNQQNTAATAADPASPAVHLAGIRPWLQDFDMGAVYDAARVRAQMRAVVDAGASGWLLWNAANVYTESALEKAP
jgi:hypothetical protein